MIIEMVIPSPFHSTLYSKGDLLAPGLLINLQPIFLKELPFKRVAQNRPGYLNPVFIEIADAGYIGKGRSGEDASFDAYIKLEAAEPQPLPHLGGRPVF